jgi:TonB family protein
MKLRCVLAVMVLVAVAGGRAAAQGTVSRIGDAGVTAPVLIRESKPSYTAQAMRERAQGVVKLTCVIGTDGKPRDIHVVTPLHPELDEQAISALSRWEFKPGVKDGVAVPVFVNIEMSFTLRAGPRDRVLLDSAGVFKKGDAGVVMPVVLSDVKPKYTPEAMRERVEGSTLLDCVVLTDGTVGDVRVARSLRTDLDEEAVNALRKWRFTPGTKDDVPVPVQVQIEITFRLK